ncbi:MAG: outer membrane protein transport protein [Candidatus Cloacimonetes bacterium]|nr:outer membrane protein transport protein [Candidatus Cloacimonadota bacterium]
MGKTTIITCMSSNAVFENPANLARIINNNIQVSARFFYFNLNKETNSDEQYEYDYPMKIKPTSFSIAYPMRINDTDFTLGLGYRTYFDFQYKYTYSYKFSEIENKATYTSKGGFNTLSIGSGYKTGNLSIGLTYNIGIFSKENKTSIFTSSGGNDQKVIWKGDISGSFFNIGISYEFNKKFTIGFVYRNSFTYTNQYDYFHYDSNLLVEEGTGKIEDEIPELLICSFQYNPSSKIKTIAEIHRVKFLESYNSEDGINIRLGIEYLYNFPVRFGLFRDIYPWPEKHRKIYGITGGMGIPITKDIYSDIACEAAFCNWDYVDSKYSTSQMKVFISMGYVFK